MQTPSTRTDRAAGHSSGVAVRALAAPELRSLEALDDDDVRRLTAFLLTPHPPWAFLVFLVVVSLLRTMTDHPLLTWLNLSLLAFPGFLVTGWWLAHRRYSAFLRDELHLDAQNARALLHIFVARDAKQRFGRSADEQVAHTRTLIGKARARRDGTG
jgi:hypothetical protein